MTRQFGPPLYDEQVQSPLGQPPEDLTATLLREILTQASARSTAGQAEAQQAQQALQTAESTPAPQVGVIQSGAARGLARLGQSLAGGKPDYAGQINKTISDKNKEMREARLENMGKLRGTYEKAAERAQQLGDTEAELKTRVAIKKLDLEAQKERKEAEADAKVALEKDKAAARKELEDFKAQARSDLETQRISGQLDRDEYRRQTDALNIRLRAMEARLTQKEKPLSATQMKARLMEQGAKGVLDYNDFEAKRSVYARQLGNKKANKKAVVQNLKYFDLNYRRAGETPEQFDNRLTATKDPLNPKKPLYTDDEIEEAGMRLFTPDE